MQAELTVALGAEDAVLELPWESEDGSQRFFDLRRDPELIFEITEANGNPALLDLLVSLNSEKSAFQSAKCDTWLSNEMDAEDEFFGALWKFGCYVDAVYVDTEQRSSYDVNFAFANSLSELLERAPEIPASAEVVLRACESREAEVIRGGFALTLYVLGYGDEPEEARRRWEIAVRLMQAAIQQLLNAK